MEWIDANNGDYKDLLNDDGNVCGWAKVEADCNIGNVVEESWIGDGNFYGCSRNRYVRADTLEECMALVVVYARMGG